MPKKYEFKRIKIQSCPRVEYINNMIIMRGGLAMNLFSPRTIQNTKKEAKNIEIIKLVVSGKSSV